MSLLYPETKKNLPHRNSHGRRNPEPRVLQIPNPTLETLQSNQEAPLPVGGRRWAAAGSQSRSRRQGERGEIPLPCLAQLALMEMEVEVEQTGMGRAWSGGARARCSPPHRSNDKQKEQASHLLEDHARGGCRRYSRCRQRRDEGGT